MRTKWNQNARQTLADAQRAQKAIEAGAVTASLRALPCAVLFGGA